MKRITLLCAAMMVAGAAFAQTDTTSTRDNDTIRIGNITIIKKKKSGSDGDSTSTTAEVRTVKKPSKTSTNWWILDLGFANLRDETVYGSPEVTNYLRTPNGEADLNLHTSKTSNVNLWFFMQRLNLAKGYVNLKYGLGLEMFNYRYETNIGYHKNPAYIFMDTVNYSKNKLFTSYLSVPLMLNFNATPGKKGFSVSAGISAGYLIASRNKQVSDERGKEKIKGDFDLEKFRVAYIAELGLGPVRLFGSYSTTALHENGLKQYPYSFGVRFSNW